jgi:hypothetical protein
MTSSRGAVPHDLAARLFRALYDDYDLHTIGDLHIAVAKGAPCYTGRTLSEIARQVSDCDQEGQNPPGTQSG